MGVTPDSPIDWTEDGQPRSRLFGDVYFSAADGLAESRAVFLAGCDLPRAWRGRDRFVVGELGFGTGLNVAALLDLWRQARPQGGRLHVFTLEAHPVTAAEAARALSAWPELKPVTDLLIARWPSRTAGFHRIDLPELDVIIDLAVMEAAEALSVWAGKADAWFLDGFAPALNPAMWRDEVLALVAARSAPGAAAATFTVAGSVRRGLAAAGFSVAKRPGHGRKRERLEARAPGLAAASRGRRVAIVGAGVAGAAAARAVRRLGGEALIFEAVAAGAGASGNPAALVTPRLDAGAGPPARLSAQTFARALQAYEECPEAIIARGVLQLAARPSDAARHAKLVAAGLFEGLALADAESASARLGEAAPGGLDQTSALVVEPGAVLRAWAGAAVTARITGLTPAASAWILTGPDGAQVARADAVIVCAGLASTALVEGLALAPVRGQASWTEGGEQTRAAAWGGYAVPTRTGVLFGATHDRGVTDATVQAADHHRNRATLAAALPGLAARLGDAPLAGRAAIRAATADHLPLAGAAPGAEDGLYVLCGLGGRGFALAPLLAEHVAALALGAPSPLPADLAALTDPARFARRAARRGHSRLPQNPL